MCCFECCKSKCRFEKGVAPISVVWVSGSRGNENHLKKVKVNSRLPRSLGFGLVVNLSRVSVAPTSGLGEFRLEMGRLYPDQRSRIGPDRGYPGTVLTVSSYSVFQVNFF